MATDTVIEDTKGLVSSAETIVSSIATSDQPLEATVKYAKALGEGALDVIKNAPDAIVRGYENVTAQISEANKASGLEAAEQYGALGGAVLGATVGPTHGKGKVVGEITEAAVRKVEGELVDKAGNEMVEQVTYSTGHGMSTVVEKAKHVAADAKSAIMHPAETVLRKSGLIDVDTVLTGIANKPLSAMASMDIKHHGVGESMIEALQAQKAERANALLEFAAENPVAAERLKKANHEQLERLVMSPAADEFLGVKSLPKMLERPLTPAEQKLNDDITRISEFTGGAADVEAAKQRQAARESMTPKEKVLDYLATHVTYPGGHRPSIDDADRFAMAAEHSDAAALKTLAQGVVEKVVVGKVIVAGAMYAAYKYMDSPDKEAEANAFLKAASIHNGFDSEQFKKDHPELLQKAVPIYNAMEQGMREQYTKDGHVITSEDQKQIDIAMCHVAHNMAEIIRIDGPGMEGKNIADELGRSNHAECAASM